MFAERMTAQNLRDVIIPREDFHPWPTCDERDMWMALPEEMRSACVDLATESLDEPWSTLSATEYLQFARTGNRSDYQALYFSRRSKLLTLVLGECIEGEGRFLDAIIDGIWAICEESSWCLPAHVKRQKAGPGLSDVEEPLVALFSAETSALLAGTAWLLRSQLDAVSPLICNRIELEVGRRILSPARSAFFWWMGDGTRKLNNWTPWVCSNWLITTLLLERDETKRLGDVEEIGRILDRFIEDYGVDGGCDEGPSYWGHAGGSLFDCLELLHAASRGKIDFFSDPLIGKIASYIMGVHIVGPWFVNFSDAGPRLSPDWALLSRFAARIHNPSLADFAASFAPETPVLTAGRLASFLRVLPALLHSKALRPAYGEAPLFRDTWFSDIQVMTARDRVGSAKGLFVAAKGGHNRESHNHNDVGNFIVYADGRPLIVDAGVGTYTRQTFGAGRYDLWTMQSTWHNLPTINGYSQLMGSEYRAGDVEYESSDEAVMFRLDIGGAYPPEAGVAYYRREVALHRGREVIISDSYSVAGGRVSLRLLTAAVPEVDGDGRIALAERTLGEGYVSGAGYLSYDAQKVAVVIGQREIEDARLQEAWGDQLYYIDITPVEAVSEGSIVLRIGC
jgi:Heparinase II/III-like protein